MLSLLDSYPGSSQVQTKQKVKLTLFPIKMVFKLLYLLLKKTKTEH